MRFRPYAWMPRPLKWLSRVLTVVVVFGLILAGAGVWTVRASFPQLGGELKVDGLTGKVTVYRDKTGIPHIYADSPNDLFLAQGYVHAQDRFFEMDFRRHVTAGRLSEMFGSATLPEDKVIRTMGWRKVAEEELPMLSEQTRAYLGAYAKGVNTWMGQHKGFASKSLEYAIMQATSPAYEPEPWTPVDSVAWLKAMAWDLRSNMEDEIGRALAASKLPRDQVEQLWPGYPFDTHQPIVTQGSVTARGFDQAKEPGRPTARRHEARARTRERAQARTRFSAGTSTDALTRASEAMRAVPSLMGDRGRQRHRLELVGGGRQTHQSGKPLLSNDPHLSAGMPSVWYQTGLHCRTERQVPVRCHRLHLLRCARRDHRPQRQDLLGLHQPRPRRHRPVPGAAEGRLLPVHGQLEAARRPGTRPSRWPGGNRSSSRSARPCTGRSSPTSWRT